LLVAARVAGQERPNPGDLLILGNCTSFIGIEQCGAFVSVFEPQLTHRFTAALRISNGAGQVFANSAMDIVFSPGGDLHVGLGELPGLLKYSSAFEFVSSTFAPGVFGLAMDAERTLFALRFSGALRRQPLSGPATEIMLPLTQGYVARSGDLGLDQCTFFYAESIVNAPGNPHVKRYDVCRGVALPDLAFELQPCTTASPTLRVAPDGSILVSNCSVIYRSREGFVQRLTLPAGHVSRAFVVAADGLSLWSVSTEGTIVQVDINTAAVLRSAPLGFSVGISGLAIYGVPRAAVQSGVLGIPLFDSLGALAMFAAALASVAVLYPRG
jgi:hypothetical protein